MVGRILGFLLAGSGILLMALGLLFLVGSAGLTSRYLVAFASLGLGLAATIGGLTAHRLADLRDPKHVRGEILGEAKRRGGVVTEAELAGLLAKRWEIGKEVLGVLAVDGQCERRQDGAVVSWVFPSLQPRLAVRECEHCGGTLPLGEEVTTCPSCGGALTTAVKRVDLASDDAYSMDE